MSKDERKFKIKGVKVKKGSDEAKTIELEESKVDLGDGKEKTETVKGVKGKVDGVDVTFKVELKVSAGFYGDNIEVIKVEPEGTFATTYTVEEKGTATGVQWRWPWTIATALLVVAIIGGFVWWWMSSNNAEEKEEQEL